MGRRVLSDKDVVRLLAPLVDDSQFVFLDNARPQSGPQRSLLFVQPNQMLVCHAGDDRGHFFDKMRDFLDRGHHLAGWLAYEFFHDQRFRRPPHTSDIVAEFGVYDHPRVIDGTGPPLPEPDLVDLAYGIEDLSPSMSRDQYCRAIERILAYIGAGDTYQVNYTYKFTFSFTGSILGLYQALRRSQPVPYGALIRSGTRSILSFSPELFFRCEGGRITARPMKGTSKRGHSTDEDRTRARALHGDGKNRSENVMIVDLLRNDLSRLLSEIGGGTVHVESLFDVETYRSVLQMTSTVVGSGFPIFPKGRIDPGMFFKALFPCGSVTGAPKIRTMEIIDELETQPRGVYTGAIGYFAPDGTAVFNVPIRTLVVQNDRGEMGIGSGIVADSIPEQEWEECLLKARFVTNPMVPFGLLETMLYQPGTGYQFIEDHLARLAEAAEYFQYQCDLPTIRRSLEDYGRSLSVSSCARVRLVLQSDGEMQLHSTPCDPPGATNFTAATALDPVVIGIAAETIDTDTPFFSHKTTRRDEYERFYAEAAEKGLFDMVLVNSRGEVTEGCITNLIVYKNGEYLTPAAQCGLLPGVRRSRLLAGAGGKPVREAVLTPADINTADALFVCNSIRGVLPARLARKDCE
jgi:para-aminobenzoate synthetase/4-amino-4-deoxychorismate lyase